jgi:hypothetical protein
MNKCQIKFQGTFFIFDLYLFLCQIEFRLFHGFEENQNRDHSLLDYFMALKKTKTETIHWGQSVLTQNMVDQTDCEST